MADQLMILPEHILARAAVRKPKYPKKGHAAPTRHGTSRRVVQNLQEHRPH